MTSMAQLRYSPLLRSHHCPHTVSDTRISANHISFSTPTPPSKINLNLNLNLPSNRNPNNFLCFSSVTGISNIGGNNDGKNGGNSGGGGGGGGGDFGDSTHGDSTPWWEKLGILGMFFKGWKSRVAADPQFPFKVLMEEVVGVTSCVLGDMASRPNFGLNELDFVFSTLVVGSILNFTLMYLLAPTAASSVTTLPWIFRSCPTSHMFEPGSFGLVERFGTFVYKGAVFAAVGFAAGLAGTALSNGLIKMRKKMDPDFETPNKAPPTLLNATTWAMHMGLSSNFRYQTLNGVEFLLAKAVPPAVFKTAVVGLRCANNVLGGMSFVVLARMTGSQSVGDSSKEENGVAMSLEEKEKLVNHGGEGEGLPNNQST